MVTKRAIPILGNGHRPLPLEKLMSINVLALDESQIVAELCSFSVAGSVSRYHHTYLVLLPWAVVHIAPAESLYQVFLA